MRFTVRRASQTFPPTRCLTYFMQGCCFISFSKYKMKVNISVSGSQQTWYPSSSARSHSQVRTIKLSNLASCQFPSPPDNQHSSSSAQSVAQGVVPNQAREKWIKKRTAVKIRNGAANHRGNDVIVLEGRDQVLHGRFNYGPFDMSVLSGEKVIRASKIFYLQSFLSGWHSHHEGAS